VSGHRYQASTLRIPHPIIVTAGIIMLSVPALADDMSGQTTYLQNCAACHGIDGRGAGSASIRLRIKSVDLAVLARRNNGVYSAEAVYEMIDGRKASRVHRDSEMPIWGCRQMPPSGKRKAKELDSLLDLSCDSESVIRQRIESIVDYLRRIQVE